MTAFLNTGSQMNLLRQVQDSMSSVDGMIQRYGSFCDLLDVPYSPPSDDIVRKWPSVFAPGRTFGMYISHLEEAFQLLGYSSEWRSPALAGAAKGLVNAMDMCLEIDNSMNRTCARRVTIAETLRTDFGEFTHSPFFLVLRGPSEALPEKSDPPTATMDTPPLQADQSLLGLRKLADGSTRLILKMN